MKKKVIEFLVCKRLLIGRCLLVIFTIVFLATYAQASKNQRGEKYAQNLNPKVETSKNSEQIEAPDGATAEIAQADSQKPLPEEQEDVRREPVRNKEVETGTSIPKSSSKQAEALPKPSPVPVPVTPVEPDRPDATWTAPTQPSTQPQNNETEAILKYINLEREKNGLNPVAINSTLNKAAQAKSNHMLQNKYFAHTSPDGISDIYFINQSGYKYRAVGINLAQGNFGGAEGLVNAWMNSEGHRKNILADFGREVGLGIAGDYYTMIIGQPV
jgi:uncharacterized protein YkwD